jgi:hypothetical protein
MLNFDRRRPNQVGGGDALAAVIHNPIATGSHGFSVSPHATASDLRGDRRMVRSRPANGADESVFERKPAPDLIGVDIGSREENASKQESRAPFRFYRDGKGSRLRIGVKRGDPAG